MIERTIVVIIVLVLSSCALFVGSDESLSLECQPFTTNELRTDGYYYEGEITPEETTEVYYFYRNGILRSLGSYSGKDFYDQVHADSSPDSAIVTRAFKSDWGTFQINGKKLVFEKWEPASGPYFVVGRRTGEILNDSTFSVDIVDGSDGRLENFKREIFHFKQFRHKPDSTNDFISCQ